MGRTRGKTPWEMSRCCALEVVKRERSWIADCSSRTESQLLRRLSKWLTILFASRLSGGRGRERQRAFPSFSRRPYSSTRPHRLTRKLVIRARFQTLWQYQFVMLTESLRGSSRTHFSHQSCWLVRKCNLQRICWRLISVLMR